LNKSYVADNAEYSISDVSAWFQTKIPTAGKVKEVNKNLAEETFETKVANFRGLLMKVKEIIDGESRVFKKALSAVKKNFFYRLVQRQH
jgi:hypothetical protein